MDNGGGGVDNDDVDDDDDDGDYGDHCHNDGRTFVVDGRRLIDGQRERDNSGNDKNNERDILQRFPDELQESFRWSRRYDVRAKYLLAMPYVLGGPA